MSFGGFYKGEKKKKKKGQEARPGSGVNSPFVLPKVEIIRKGKREQ